LYVGRLEVTNQDLKKADPQRRSSMRTGKETNEQPKFFYTSLPTGFRDRLRGASPMVTEPP
jgi:hypothetical protein